MRLWFGLLLVVVGLASACSRSEDDQPSHGMSPEAFAYLDQALDLLEQHAYQTGRVDWTSARAAAYEQAAGALTPEQTHPAIHSTLASLGDGHSTLVPAALMSRIERGELDPSGFGIRTADLGRHGYILVPAFAGAAGPRADRYTIQLQEGIARLGKKDRCGWIVDLRDNPGGNMYPMIRGLSAFLGKGTLGYFVKHGDRKAWHVGMAGSGRVVTVHDPALLDAPVAVLIGPRTASSGEATLLSFQHRANTKTVGEPTAGLTTGNQAFPLPDGSVLAIMTTVMADRSGKVYGSQVVPDSVVTSTSGQAAWNDEVARAAIAWMEALPACSRPVSTQD